MKKDILPIVKISSIVVAALLLLLIAIKIDQVVKYDKDFYMDKYASDTQVKQLILVEQSKEKKSEGQLTLLARDKKGKLKEVFACHAYLGKNGINKEKEGDAKTPSGAYKFLMAFGVGDDPGSKIPYTKLTYDMYLCGDKAYYNKFINAKKLNHKCSSNSEHLIEYEKEYKYALFLNYNEECAFGKGSAIFLHVKGDKEYTGGCISVDEDKMVQILKNVDKSAVICIF